MTTAAATETPVTSREIRTFRAIQLDLIDDNPWQPRAALEGVEELAADIELRGLLQLPRVRPVGSRFQLAFGHGRVAACRLLKWRLIDVEVKELSDEEMALEALSENERRRPVKQIDLYKAWQRALAIDGMTVQKLADGVGLDRSTVSNHLRVLQLPALVLDYVDSGELSAHGAREFLCLLGSDGHFHTTEAKSVLNKLTSGIPDWRYTRIRYEIQRAIESSSVSEWRRLFKTGSVGGTHGAGPPQFDVDAFIKAQDAKVHGIADDDWAGGGPNYGKFKQERSRDWTCATSAWVSWQTKAKAAGPAAIKVGQGSTNGSAPQAAPGKSSDWRKTLTQDPVFKAAVSEATLTVGQRAVKPKPFDADDKLTDGFKTQLGSRAAPALLKESGFKALVDGRQLDYNDKPWNAGISEVPAWFPDIAECRERCTIGATLARFNAKRPLFLYCLNQPHFQEKLEAGRALIKAKTAELLAQIDAYDEAALLDLEDHLPESAPFIAGLWRSMAASLLHQALFEMVSPAGVDFRERQKFAEWSANTRRVFELLSWELPRESARTEFDQADLAALERLDEDEACELALRLVVNAAHASKGVSGLLETMQRPLGEEPLEAPVEVPTPAKKQGRERKAPASTAEASEQAEALTSLASRARS